jgi:DNA-binding transcriptional LysR family regulator
VLLRVGELEDSSLVARQLCPVRFLYCASPDYLAARGEPRQGSDLGAHDGIGYSLIPEASLWQPGVVQGRLVHRPHLRLTSNNGEMILRAAEAGLGIALLPTFICHEAIEAGRLRAILQDHTPPPLALYALYPSRRHLPQRVRALVDFLATWFAEGPPWEV